MTKIAVKYCVKCSQDYFVCLLHDPSDETVKICMLGLGVRGCGYGYGLGARIMHYG